MPEGHSIHRLARQFTSVFAGQRLSVSSPQGRFAAGAAQLDGQTLVGAAAHGKQLFLEFDNELFLRIHLGLYGAFDFGGDETFRGASSIGAPRRVGEREIADDGEAAYAGPPPPKGAVRVRLVSNHGWADLRGPTACEVITPGEQRAILAKLGPDPLQPEADPEEFVRRLNARSSPVGLLLMNQEVLAGVGNVYRAEVLFRRQVSPWRAGKALDRDQTLQLWNDVVSVMADGVAAGRIITTLPEHRNDASTPVPTAEAHYVYKRQGLPCRICGTEIAVTDMAARKLYWCASCQDR
ncbi:Fpg/Nei family DNA glycosylase [Arthrobacter sp. Sa2CUA1]|uniref:DNA-(apurinic or apyrimidinic site) lyase n=1 Tax=Arthrobacter gallicola TaxID=2762225 RepID=A0ABR8UPU2_9MICC|nr:Fpg/Nei family DNA glycosylase [Arthrobacter gallicola]MBD7994380.1 Fpg/Nei family DNA glycosylase [Arthrobacter gallicola]